MTPLSKLLRRFNIVFFGWDLFISHRKNDSAFYARRIKEELKKRKFDCFLDEAEISSGDVLKPEIKRGLNLSQAMLLIGTPNAFVEESTFVMQEIEEFTEDIIPINVGGSLKKCPIPKISNQEKVWIDELNENLITGIPSETVLNSIELYFKKRKRHNQRIFFMVTAAGILIVLLAAIGSLYLLYSNAELEGQASKLQAQASDAKTQLTTNRLKANQELLELQTKLTNEQKKRADLEATSKRAERMALIADDITPISPSLGLAIANESYQYGKNSSALIVAKKALRMTPEVFRIKTENTGYTNQFTTLPSINPLQKLELSGRNRVVLTLNKMGELKLTSLDKREIISVISGVSNFLLSSDHTKVYCLLRTGKIRIFNLKGQEILSNILMNGDYAGIAQSPRKEMTVGWTKYGEIMNLETHEIVSNDHNNSMISALGIDDNLSSVILFYIDQMELKRIDLKRKGLVSARKIPISAQGDSTSISNATLKDFTHTPGEHGNSINLVVNERINRIAIYVSGQDYRTSLLILDAKDLYPVLERSDYFKVCFDPNQGTMAMLDNTKLEEYGLGFKDAPKLTDRWYLEGKPVDVGEAFDIHYSPGGTYILSVNAPIMDLVGPKPSLVKLYYSDKFGDSRVVDEHQARVIGEFTNKILNAAFDEAAAKIVTYATDGSLRIYEILPEYYNDPNIRSADYFNGSTFFSPSSRTLLEEENADAFFSVLKNHFGSSLNDSPLLTDVKDYVEGHTNKMPRIDQMKQRARALSVSMALQPHHTKKFETYPYPVRELPQGIQQLLVRGHNAEFKYDPLQGNQTLNDLIAYIKTGLSSLDNNEIISRYATATEEDFFLLFGMQQRKIENLLESEDPEDIQKGVILSTLMSDNSFREKSNLAMQAVKTINPSLASWSEGFLREYGRDYSLAGDFQNDQSPIFDEYLLYFPFQKTRGYAARLNLTRIFEYHPEEGKIVHSKNFLPWSTELLQAFEFFYDNNETNLALIATTKNLSDNKISSDNIICMKLFSIAMNLKARGQYNQALKWLEPTILRQPSKSPLLPDTYNQCAWMYLQLNDFSKASEYYQKTVNAHFPSAWAHINWGKALIKLNLKKEGIRKMQEGLPLASKYNKTELSDIYNSYAWQIVSNPELIDHKEFERAKQLSAISCYSANSNNPDYTNFLDTYAHFFAIESNYANAIIWEKKAADLAIDPEQKRDFQEKIKRWESMMH